jgi:hypothetical protein
MPPEVRVLDSGSRGHSTYPTGSSCVCMWSMRAPVIVREDASLVDEKVAASTIEPGMPSRQDQRR